MPFDREILDAAALWAVRTQEPSFDDWPAFTTWLEADPAHGKAYDFVTLAAEEGAAALLPQAANDEAGEPAPTRSRPPFLRLMSGLVACLALVSALWVWQSQGAMDIYRTAPGETRVIALDDGSSITLAGGSQVAVDADGARLARLEAGQALFEIRHDESDPFVLGVGTAKLVDAGTVFDVAIRSGEVTLGVSEGAVVFNPARQNVRVEPGEALTFASDGSDFETAEMPRDQVGEWREGRVTFRDASLEDIAADITRSSGVSFVVADGAGTSRISGSVSLSALREDPKSLGPLLGITVRREGDSWVLSVP
jgi:transmembrane sensor